MSGQVNKVYELCINSTYEEYQLDDDNTISLINIRDTAIDGGYENDEQAYKEMIKQALEELNE